MRVAVRQSAGREKETLTPYDDVRVIGTTYPSCYLMSGDTLFQPVLETVQSTGVSTTDVTDVTVPPPQLLLILAEPVFFFLNNTDNYFHWLYDAVPLLTQYLRLRETTHPTLRLLMTSKCVYPFVTDTLLLLGISSTDILQANEQTLYKRVLVPSSPTHEGCSNEPPHSSIWSVYRRLVVAAGAPTNDLPRKVYVSRRSWIHGDTSNIGTNYTTRRKLLCEDELVKALEKKGYAEVFCETMTMTEKIRLFANATHVVGAIGGGMCNLVFANSECKTVCLCSPDFERINKRFLFTMAHTQVSMFRKTWSTSMLYRRAKVGDQIGEIIAEEGDVLTLALGNGVTWSDGDSCATKVVSKSDVTFLDEGLNSSWNLDVLKCMEVIQ